MSLGRPINIDVPGSAVSNFGSFFGLEPDIPASILLHFGFDWVHDIISQTLVNSAFADLAQVFGHIREDLEQIGNISTQH